MYYTLTIVTLKICMYFCLYFQFSDNQISIIDSLPICGISEVCHGTAPTLSEVDPSRAHIQGFRGKGHRRKFNRSPKTVGSPLNGADVAKGPQQANQQDQSDDAQGWPFCHVSITSVKGGVGCIGAFQSLFSHGACVC